jgi:plasmid maintenance system antidote protein VapI
MYRNAKAEMVRAGINLSMLAEKMGNTVATWSEKLNGKRIITLDEAVRFKEIVQSDLPIEVLFEKEDI